MHSLTYLGPWEMTITEAPSPSPAADETLIDIIATGLCGSDIHGYSGETDRRVSGQVMGHETVGRVHSGGDLPVGTLVTIDPVIPCGECEFCLAGENQVCPRSRVIGVDPALPGSFAEQLLVPSANVVALSEDMSVLHGALIEPLAVGYHALMRGAPVATDRLLVIGGGPIGQAVALAARRFGLTDILVSEPTEARRELLTALNFATTSPDTIEEDVREKLSGAATLVIDAVGIGPSLAAATAHSTTRARVVLVGMGATSVTIAPYGFTVSERSLIGSYCYSAAHFRETAAWVAAGRPELDLLIDRVLPLAGGAEAFRSAAKGGLSNKTLLRSDLRADAAASASSTTEVQS